MSALRTTATVLAALLLALLATGAGKAGVRPGTADGAELVKTGWWWAGNDTPLDETAVAPPQPSPPNVPEGTLPVAAAGGEPEKYAALEFRLGAEPGGYVEQAVLVLRENTGPGATLNAENATVLACPVTESFWADGASGAWKARPGYDCDLASAAGERDAETGLWRFDLGAIAALWTAEGHQGSTSVALVEGVEAPEAFQVSFDGPALEGVGYRFVVGEGPATAPLTGADLPASTTGAGAPATAGPAPTGPVAAGSGAGTGSLLSGSTTTDGAAGPLAGTAGVAPLEAEAAPVEEPVTAAPATAQTAPVAAPVGVPPWYSGIPVGGYLLVPVGLGLAYLLMLALGPDAQPAAGPSRHGVSRALDRLRSAGAGLTSRGKN